MNLPGFHFAQAYHQQTAPRATHTHVKIVRRRSLNVTEPPVKPHKRGFFHRFSAAISEKTGSPVTFVIALLAVVVWAVTGPLFDYSNTWQLAINTGTTIITFLMVFAIQGAQNRDSKAVQLKLDELIRASQANDEFVDVEDLDDIELEALHTQFQDMHEKFLSRREHIRAKKS